MSRKKLKALTFGDYGINIVASILGSIALSWILKFSFGSLIYSIFFCITLLLFMYSRGALAAKIDLRTNEASIKKAFELAMPLTIFLVCLTAVYSLFYYDILPAKNVVLKSITADDGAIFSVYLFDIIVTLFRTLFLNVTGFSTVSSLSPFMLLICPAIVVCGICFGYFFGMRKIYISEYLIKAKDFIVTKFNE